MSELVKGSVLFFNLYDVCEEIRLETVRNLLGAIPQPRTFKHAAPEYVRFEQPPVIEPIQVVGLSPQHATGQVKYYEYGVISVSFELPFHEELGRIVELAEQWMSSTQFEGAALQIVREKVRKTESAMVRRYTNWIDEDYFIFQFHEVEGVQTASELLARYGGKIAQLVRGETIPLSKEEQTEILQSHISYYPTDVVVIGWNASIIYDTPAGAQTTIQLSRVRQFAVAGIPLLRRVPDPRTLECLWSSQESSRRSLALDVAETAHRLQSITVEVTELVEKVDNSIKFLSDMFSARLYRLAATKVGVPDYKSLVNQKLHTAEDLYRSMNDEFQASRGFVLEVMVVIILIIELVFLFRGK